MAGLNRIEVIGRLGRDPETRYTGSGKPVSNFSVAVDDGYGEKKHTEWFAIVAWDKKAEFAQKVLQKGSLVHIAGPGRTREWQDKQGSKRSKFEVNALEIILLAGGKPKDGASGNNGAHDEQDQRPYQASDEDIPF